MPFLFDPGEVAARLAALPNLCAVLRDPHVEGQRSAAFPLARKSPREIYRVLSRVDCYAHLAAFPAVLERCLTAGFDQPAVVRTRARKQFVEALAEIRAADHFLLRGFTVKGQDTSKEQESVPDLIVSRDNVTVAVEVYCPRSWENLSYLATDLQNLVENMDLPYDYEFRVDVTQAEEFADGRLLLPHPAEISEKLGPDVRTKLLDEVEREISANLGAAALGTLTVQRRLCDANLCVSVELTDISARGSRLPRRWGVISPPGMSGYAPEGMFDRIVQRVRDKAREAQAVGAAPVSLLLVDLTLSELDAELQSPVYRRLFHPSLDRHLGDGLHGYDLVGFCTGREWGSEMMPHFLCAETDEGWALGNSLIG